MITGESKGQNQKNKLWKKEECYTCCKD